MSESQSSPYEFTLRAAEGRCEQLKRQIGDLQRELREMETTVSGILRLAGGSVPTTAPVTSQNVSPSTINPTAVRTALPILRAVVAEADKYSSLSTRWAILLALSTHSEPMSIPEIAEELQNGGFDTQAKNFNNNLSSVLGRMKSDRGEVDLTEGKWKITEIGLSAITYIRAQKLRRRAPANSKGGDAA